MHYCLQTCVHWNCLLLKTWQSQHLRNQHVCHMAWQSHHQTHQSNDHKFANSSAHAQPLNWNQDESNRPDKPEHDFDNVIGPNFNPLNVHLQSCCVKCDLWICWLLKTWQSHRLRNLCVSQMAWQSQHQMRKSNGHVWHNMIAAAHPTGSPTHPKRPVGTNYHPVAVIQNEP